MRSFPMIGGNSRGQHSDVDCPTIHGVTALSLGLPDMMVVENHNPSG